MTDYRRPIRIVRLAVDPVDADALAAECADRWGQLPVVWTAPERPDVWLEMYYSDSVRAALVEACLQGDPRVRGTKSYWTDPADWESAFRAQFEPFVVGRRLRVCPVWARPSIPRDDRLNLWIDPGLSFGTGRHFTTRFCLEIIDQLWLESAFCSFLDVGAGSGLLAIAAARLGCPRVVAWEKDEGVIPYTERNLELNGCVGDVALHAVDLRRAPPVERFDLVCGNLLGGLILHCADRLAALSTRWLALTGIREVEVERVARAFARRGGREVRRAGDGEWSGLLLAWTDGDLDRVGKARG